MKKILNALVISSVLAIGSVSYAEEAKMDMKKMDMSKTTTRMKMMSSDKVVAMAQIINTAGKKIGVASFLPVANGVKISVQVMGLTPGLHGIHIHETGKCDTPSFKSAGGHFNPINHQHGLKNKKGAHNGDMQNIIIDKSGNGSVIMENKMISLGSGTNSLLKVDGTSIVIHAKIDDQKSQPAGKAGDRVGCGVIEVLK